MSRIIKPFGNVQKRVTITLDDNGQVQLKGEDLTFIHGFRPGASRPLSVLDTLTILNNVTGDLLKMLRPGQKALGLNEESISNEEKPTTS